MGWWGDGVYALFLQTSKKIPKLAPLKKRQKGGNLGARLHFSIKKKKHKQVFFQSAILSITRPDRFFSGFAKKSDVCLNILDASSFNNGNLSVTVLKGWPADWVLKTPCAVSKSGIAPLPAAALPPVCFGLVTQVKSYEGLAAQSAVAGKRPAGVTGASSGPAANKIQALPGDTLAINKACLSQFN